MLQFYYVREKGPWDDLRRHDVNECSVGLSVTPTSGSAHHEIAKMNPLSAVFFGRLLQMPPRMSSTITHHHITTLVKSPSTCASTTHIETKVCVLLQQYQR